MVPGSTLRYGSSFCRETLRWRAFRMFPSDAAVIPLPSEETTPPVTKTYFDIGDLQGGFSNLTGSEPRPNISRRLELSLGLCSRLQKHELRVVLAGRRLDRQLGKRLAWGQPHLFQEPVDGDEQDVGRRKRLGLRVVEAVTEITQVADADVVDLDQVDRVPPVLRPPFGVVVRGHADHGHAGDFVFTRPADLVRLAHRLGVVVILVVVADRDQVGVEPLQLQPDRGRVRVGDDGSATAAKPEAAVSKPG